MIFLLRQLISIAEGLGLYLTNLTISCFDEENFEPPLKCCDSVCLLNMSWKLLPQEGGLMLKALAPIALLETLETT